MRLCAYLLPIIVFWNRSDLFGPFFALAEFVIGLLVLIWIKVMLRLVWQVGTLAAESEDNE